MIERTNESLSALMDGEADELEIRRLLNQSTEQEALLETWHNYQLIGSLLRDEPAFKLDLAKGVRQALDGEPMDDVASAPLSGSADQALASVQPSKWRWLMASGAVAASVTMAVLVGVQWQQQGGEQGLQMAQSTDAQAQENIASVASAPIELSAEQQQQLKEAQLKLQEYVLKHNDDTGTSAARVMLPHARTVNFSQGVEKR